ncbi:MarR family winged helix-turn-helix transcriptional regulator [Spartinivicinus ruber]|uniref:MarR family winged helix-turn-helix transcriptional regulator n=1 Tax=Spartinivicinus ruber TaxID=2683272 RepID=UPI0013D56EA4|nr:MarR family winged helix-turn-helix transcriptional regulator [Spartinivicinus ruber]
MKLDESLDCFHRYLARLWNQDQRQAELSFNEYEYLTCLAAIEGVCDAHQDTMFDGPHLTDLAAKMQVKRASASTMVNKLEKRGLIQRVQCRYDARAQHVLVTKAGMTLVRKEQAIYKDMATTIKQQLTKEEYRQFEKVMDKVCKHL